MLGGIYSEKNEVPTDCNNTYNFDKTIGAGLREDNEDFKSHPHLHERHSNQSRCVRQKRV